MISLRAVTKTYRPILGRPVHAVTDVTLDVAAGEVVGIAGPNGAGKTTILAMLLGLLRPTSGAIEIGGLEPRRYVERAGIAYLPELMALIKTWRVDDALRRLSVLAGVPAGRERSEVDRVVATLEIGEHRRKRIRQLSKGNFQRVGLAQALLRDHDVVIFDEPTHGLDPVWTQRFRTVVAGLRAPARAMLIASHNLDELERVCDRVAIIDHGRVQRVVDVRGGGPAASRVYRIRFAGAADALLAAFAGASVVGAGEIETPALEVDQLNTALQRALAGGAQVTALAARESALEAEFHAAVRSAPPGGAP